MCACVNVTCNYRPISASLKLGPSSKHRHSETHTAVKLHTYSGVWRVHVCLHALDVSDSLGFAQLSGVGFHLSTLRQNYEVYWHETVKEKNTSDYLIIIVISSKIVQSHPEASRSAIQSLKGEENPIDHSRFRTAGSHRGLEKIPRGEETWSRPSSGTGGIP